MILVTGATGRTGQHVVDHLLASGQDVRILARTTSTVPERWTNVERAIGDLEDAASLRAAMEGANGLFVLSPMDPDLDVIEQSAFAAAADAGVGHVVKMSTTTPHPQSPIPWWRAHWRSEEALRRSDLTWTILRPNGITFFLLGHADTIRERGELRTAGGDGRMALIDADDIGAVAAVVFRHPEQYASKTLDLTGPDAVSYGDVAAMITKLTGHHVRHVDVTPEQGMRESLAAGRPDWEAEGMVANWRMTRDGSGGFDRVTNDVADVLGRPPLGVEQFLAAHAAEFTEAA